jgi:predicted transcriptional regulator
MKRFFDEDGGDARASVSVVPSKPPMGTTPAAGARIAVYDGLIAAPRVEELLADDLGAAIEQLASRTYNLARERGGSIPYTIIREVSENLIHAGFREVVVTILEDGALIRFADQGPGIPDKEKVFLPGFSTATADMKRVIRGVGSGLPIVRETLAFAGGTIEIDDNLGSGTVVTLKSAPPLDNHDDLEPAPVVPRLSDRQKRALATILELGAVGPTRLSNEIGVSLATAHRELTFLEDADLIVADQTGKRTLTEHGIACLERVFG